MKTIGYVRVSSVNQVKNGGSIDNQISKINDYCKFNGLDLIDVVEDLGISGRSLNRAGIQYLLNKISNKEIECLVVNDLSRLGRNLKQVLSIITLLRSNNICLHIIKEGIREDNNMSNLLLNIMGSINEFEVSQLGERIQEVKTHRKRVGKSYSNPQYGYKNIEGRIYIDKEEMSNRRRIRRLRRKGYSWLDIEKEFEKRGILGRSGGKFYGSTMCNIFKSKEIEICSKYDSSMIED